MFHRHRNNTFVPIGYNMSIYYLELSVARRSIPNENKINALTIVEVKGKWNNKK